MDWIKEHKALVIVGVIGVLFIAMFVRGCVATQAEEKKAEEAKQAKIEEIENVEASEAETEGNDNLLLSMQDDLVAQYGKLPKGYIWDFDGTLLSLGDKRLSAEEVVYSYFRGIQSLDMSTVQKYSRKSLVVSAYDDYFSDIDKSTDYTDNFLRNMYKNCMLSMQVEGITNSANFANNKKVFTVKVKMLDLTTKDFWKPDKMKIYKDLKIYNSDESDSARADIYLYDYIMKYYESGAAALRETTFDVTVQRYPDLDTGWLVSVDTDVDSACRYADGKLVVSYINEMFIDEGMDLLEEQEHLEKVKAKKASQATKQSSKR